MLSAGCTCPIFGRWCLRSLWLQFSSCSTEWSGWVPGWRWQSPSHRVTSVSRLRWARPPCAALWDVVSSYISLDSDDDDNTCDDILIDWLWCCHHGSEPLGEFTPFTWWMQTRRQMAANPQTKPNNLDCESASRLLPSTCTIAVLLLLGPKAGIHFTVWRRVEGVVGLGPAVRVAARAQGCISHSPSW